MSVRSSNMEPKSPPRIPRLCGDPAMADNRTAVVGVVMQTRYLWLLPVLLLIAGCSEKIEAHEHSSATSEIGMPPEQKDEAAKASDEWETDLKRHSPGNLD